MDQEKQRLSAGDREGADTADDDRHGVETTLPPTGFVYGIDGRIFRGTRPEWLRRHTERLSVNAIAARINAEGWPIGKSTVDRYLKDRCDECSSDELTPGGAR